MSSFEEVTLELPEYEIDNEFANVLADARSLNEFYRSRGTPVDYEVALADLTKLNEKWMRLESQEDVTANGRLILNDDANPIGDIFHSSEEYAFDVGESQLRGGKFILHDTLQVDGSKVVSGVQEIKFTGLVDVAKLTRGFELDYIDEGDDDESEFDEEAYEDAEGEVGENDGDDDPNLGMVWGIVSIEQIEQRFIAINPKIEDEEMVLDESCRKHFARIRERLDGLNDLTSQITALSDFEAIPEHREDMIAMYRELLEVYLNDKIPFEENIPYILQTDGQYARHTLEEGSGEYVVSDEAKPANIVAINLKLVVAYDEVGLPAISLRAYDLFGKDKLSSRLNIPLRSVLDIESTKSILQAKLDETNE